MTPPARLPSQTADAQSPAHSRPPAPTTWQRDLEPLRPTDVARLRQEAVDHLRQTRLDQGHPADDDALDNIVLVISELVTNVLKHVATPDRPVPARLLMLLDGDDVLVVVSDPGTVGPLLDTTAPGLEEGGLGLGLVRTLTDDRWGWHPLPLGKAVWAQCRLTARATTLTRSEP